MNRIYIYFIGWMLLGFSSLYAGVFDTTEIENRMIKAADWQLENPTRFGVLEWHCAPFYMGLSDLYEITGDEKYLDAVKNTGAKHHWNIGNRRYHADDHAVGLSYVKMYQNFNDKNMISQIQKEFDWILANPPEKTIVGEDGKVRLRYNRERWNWCDALYMAAPVWAGLGAVTGQEKYIDYMVQEWKQAHDWYWCEEESLYFHDRRDITKVSLNGNKVFWARGDGWVIAALVEVLQFLPKDHPERNYFESIYKKMSAKLLEIQKVNGTWAPNLLDEKDPAQDDISGSVFYVYGLAWGINNGILDKEKYESSVLNGWKALCDRQKEDGRLINIQPVGGYPVAFDPDHTVIFGIGGFLSAGSEVWKLVKVGY
ncbi:MULTISPECIES: glycoside hydrolase family 88/105 protein [unclassified Saccharicrinis]|uniref:glycoside hydrolase family 88/105 protein n=1 Tax=unclassified Saccharicrinis TaxID=2646859 RepID=UPI003D33F271